MSLEKFLLISSFVLLSACNVNSAKNQFRLAEQLFSEKKYGASIHEFDKIVQRDPQSEYGLKALQRIATIEHLYLDKPDDALKSYKLLLKRLTDKDTIRDIEKLIAEIYFERFENYSKAIEYYKMIQDMDASDPDADYVVFRLGRSYFLESRFSEAIATFNQLKQKYPQSEYSLKADLEIANALSSQGNCKDAIGKYEEIIESGKQSLKNLAVFGMASCYEELDNLDKSYDLLASIQEDYPIPQVVSLKMQKIKRRKILRRR